MECVAKKVTHAAGITALAGLIALGWGSGASATVHTRVATINGASESPPNGSLATGTGTFQIDDFANTITYHIEFTVGSLSSPEIAAHIHCCAPPGMNAGVALGLPLGSPKDGMGGASAANIAGILAGNGYVNIHTMNFGGGEIRGQLTNPTPVPEPLAPETSWGSIKTLYR